MDAGIGFDFWRNGNAACLAALAQGVYNSGKGGNELREDLGKVHGGITPFVVRIEAVLLGIINDGVSREAEGTFFSENFHLLGRERGFEAVATPSL